MGLVAVIALHDEPVSPGETEGLVAAYESVRGTGPKREVGRRGDAAHVAVLDHDGNDPSAIARSNGSWAAAAGVVYSEHSLVSASLEDLDGQFALVKWDGATQEATISADPFGLQTVFTATRGKRLYVSTSALALAKHLRARPDRFGLEVFLRAGYHFGRRTNWEGIERIEPGTCLTVGPKGISRRTYWRPEIDERVAGLSFSDAVDHTLETSVATLRKYLGKQPRPWVDLSGGYDTRLLTLLLREAGVEFDTDTRGEPGGKDAEVANRIARLTGWNLLELAMPDTWAAALPDMLPVALGWADGQLEVLELSWVLWAHARLAERNRELLIGGGGEHFRGFTWRQEFLRAGRSSTVNLDNWVDMRLLHPMDTRIFARDPTAAARADFRERMVAWADPYRDELNTTQLDVMYAYKITGHFGSYASADSAFLRAELPFYFKPLFQSAFSTSYRYRNNHRLMRHLMARLDPKVAAVSTETGGPAVPWKVTNLHRFVPYYGQIAHKAVNKLSYKTFGRRLLPVSQPYHWWCPPGARQVVLERLGFGSRNGKPGLRSRALYDESELARFVAEARRDDFTDVSVLGRIVTVELALAAADAAVED